MLIASGRDDVEMKKFVFVLKFSVENFSVYSVIEGYVVEETRSDKGKFSDAQIRMINKLKRNQALTIENIMVKGPDGTTRKLPSISFRID